MREKPKATFVITDSKNTFLVRYIIIAFIRLFQSPFFVLPVTVLIMDVLLFVFVNIHSEQLIIYFTKAIALFTGEPLHSTGSVHLDGNDINVIGRNIILSFALMLLVLELLFTKIVDFIENVFSNKRFWQLLHVVGIIMFTISVLAIDKTGDVVLFGEIIVFIVFIHLLSYFSTRIYLMFNKAILMVNNVKVVEE